MIEVPTMLTFMGAVAILSLTPGPDMALLVSRGMAQGWKASWFTAFGFTLAGVIQIPFLALGIASIVQSSPVAFDILRYAGAAYLIWRGVQLIRRASRLSPQLAAGSAVTPINALRDGIVASLTNPKGMIFLLAFLPQFVDPAAGSVTMQLIVLGLLMKGVALVVESALAFGAGSVGRLFSRWPRFVLWQERLTGMVLIGLGVRLLSMDGRVR